MCFKFQENALAPAIGMCLWTVLGTCVFGQELRKPFSDREHAVLLEVVEVKSGESKAMSELRRKDPTLRNQIGFDLVVEVKAVLPASAPIENRHEVTIFHDSPNPFLRRGAQDWFPVEVGKQIVIILDGTVLPNHANLKYAGRGDPPDKVWRDCTMFYQSYNKSPTERTVEYAKYLRNRDNFPGYAFIEFMNSYDRTFCNHRVISLAFADFLRNPNVPLEFKLNIANEFREEREKYLGAAFVGERDSDSHRELASAVVEVTRDAHKAQVHPGTLYNQLVALSMGFVSRKKLEDLPRLEPAVRQELLTMLKPHEGDGSLAPLKNWLQQLEPGGYVSSGINTDRRDPSPAVEVAPNPNPPAVENVGPKQHVVASGPRALYVIWAIMIIIIIGLLGLGFRRWRAARVS